MDTQAATAPHLSPRRMRDLLDRYRVTSGKDFRLADFDPNDTAGHLLTKPQAEASWRGTCTVSLRAGKALRAGRMGGAVRAAGHGRRGKDSTIKP